MATIFDQRMSAEIEGNFVVFLIGMRINKPWKIHKWVPVFLAMPKMIRELEANPELGMMGYMFGFKVIFQYWKSFEHLESYAQSIDNIHLPAWKAFNQSVGKSLGDVGIWHETYQIRAGEYETVYSGMPPIGLGTVATLSPATRSKETARGRIDAKENIDV